MRVYAQHDTKHPGLQQHRLLQSTWQHHRQALDWVSCLPLLVSPKPKTTLEGTYLNSVSSLPLLVIGGRPVWLQGQAKHHMGHLPIGIRVHQGHPLLPIALGRLPMALWGLPTVGIKVCAVQ